MYLQAPKVKRLNFLLVFANSKVCPFFVVNPRISQHSKTPLHFVIYCVFDLCHAGVSEDDALCEMMEDYVERCNMLDSDSGNYITAWRTDERCPLMCGLNQHFEACGKSACQATTNYCAVNETACAQSDECSEDCYCNGWTRGFVVCFLPACMTTTTVFVL